MLIFKFGLLVAIYLVLIIYELTNNRDDYPRYR